MASQENDKFGDVSVIDVVQSISSSSFLALGCSILCAIIEQFNRACVTVAFLKGKLL